MMLASRIGAFIGVSIVIYLASCVVLTGIISCLILFVYLSLVGNPGLFIYSFIFSG